MASIKKVPDKKMYAGALIGLIMASIVIGVMIIFAIFMIISSIVVSKNLMEARKIFGIGLAIIKVVAPLVITSATVVSIIIIWLCRNVLKGKAKNGLATAIVLIIASATIVPFGIAGIIAGILLILGKYETKDSKDHKEVIDEK